MTFLQPWAWIGLVAVAIPIAAHLLARRPARRVLFPAVHFLPGGLQKPVSRDRLTDLALLVVRCSVITAAVAALARPVWPHRSSDTELQRSLARAILYERGGHSATGSHAGAPQSLQPVLEQLADEATVSRTAGATEPATLIDAAVAWLLTQPMRRELVVVSDFHAGALAPADLARVPDAIGIKASRVSFPEEEKSASALSLTLLAGASERSSAEAAHAAAVATGAPSGAREGRPIAVLFPGFEQRDALLKTARALNQPWMFEAVTAIEQDPLLQQAASRGRTRVADRLSWMVVALAGADTLVLSTTEPPHSLISAALIGAAARAAAGWPEPAGRAVQFMTAGEIAALERPAVAATAAASEPSPHESASRWFWIVALLLMATESLMASRRRTEVVQEPGDIARVA